MPDDSATTDRRKFLAAALGAAALAGCTGAPDGSSGNETDAGGEPPLSPPTRTVGQVDSEAWQYVLDSLEYQNAMLARLASEGE